MNRHFLIILPLFVCTAAALFSQNTLSEKEVEFHNGEVKLAGTLSIPETAGPCPAVIMITGSGQQNRDEEIFGFKIFKLISDHFVKNGIAVLRYDDRGVGGSTGNPSISTMYDFAGDARAGIELLKQNNKIDNNRIGILGHSEGGAIAPYIASRDDKIAFIIMMAGPAVSGDSTTNAQIKIMNRHMGKSEEEIKEIIIFQNMMYDEVKKDSADHDWEALEKELAKITVKAIKALPKEKQQGITDFEKFASFQAKMQLAAVKTPWYKAYLSYHPADDLQKLQIPVLALYGELDSQVLPEMNSKYLIQALEKAGNEKYKLKIFPKANHLFQEAQTGMADEYPKLKKEFVPGFLDTLSEWIKESAK